MIAPLRRRQFFSIEEINRAIKPLMEGLNRGEMKQVGQGICLKAVKETSEEIRTIKS